MCSIPWMRKYNQGAASSFLTSWTGHFRFQLALCTKHPSQLIANCIGRWNGEQERCISASYLLLQPSWLTSFRATLERDWREQTRCLRKVAMDLTCFDNASIETRKFHHSLWNPQQLQQVSDVEQDCHGVDGIWNGSGSCNNCSKGEEQQQQQSIHRSYFGWTDGRHLCGLLSLDVAILLVPLGCTRAGTFSRSVAL